MEERFEAPFVLNATYASVNQVLKQIEVSEEAKERTLPTGTNEAVLTEGTGEAALSEGTKGILRPEPFGIKYELCEIILCRVNDAFRNIGLTVMDGPFFSIMPFGKTGYHSLTSVTFTPHRTSFHSVPQFPCMEGGACRGGLLGNCNDCENRPESAWEYMSALARKYVREEYGFAYEKSLFSMKPILKASEIDDSRPTVIRYASRKPVFLSVLSGKINTVYDLDEFLDCD